MAYNFAKCNHVTWDVLEQTVQLRSSSSSVLWNREQKFGRVLFAGLEKKSSLKVMLQFLQVQVKFQKSTCVLLTQATFYFADIPLYNLSLFGIPRSSGLNRTFPVTNPSSYRVHHSGWQKGALLGFPSSPHKGRMKEEEGTGQMCIQEPLSAWTRYSTTQESIQTTMLQLTELGLTDAIAEAISSIKS